MQLTLYYFLLIYIFITAINIFQASIGERHVEEYTSRDTFRSRDAVRSQPPQKECEE